MTHQSDWMTAKEVAEEFRFPGIGAVYQAVRRGEIPCYKFGARRIRFKRAEIEAKLESGRVLTPQVEDHEEHRIFPEQKWAEERRKKDDIPPETDEDYTTAVEEATVLNVSGADASPGTITDRVTLEGSNGYEDSMPMGDRLDRAIAYDRKRRKHRPETLSARTIQQAIVAALENCPNNTCTEKSIPVGF